MLITNIIIYDIILSHIYKSILFDRLIQKTEKYIHVHLFWKPIVSCKIDINMDFSNLLFFSLVVQ